MTIQFSSKDLRLLRMYTVLTEPSLLKYAEYGRQKDANDANPNIRVKCTCFYNI